MSQTILLLEDEADIAKLVRYHLESSGYTVQAFTNASEVLPAAERKAPALFLLDIMVPGGDGLDLCRQAARRMPPSASSVPIIFLTARAAENDRVHGLELGADDYITKPFSYAGAACPREGRAAPV